jgi:hypothetical protein
VRGVDLELDDLTCSKRIAAWVDSGAYRDLRAVAVPRYDLESRLPQLDMNARALGMLPRRITCCGA